MKINELEDLLGVSGATVRYYEEQGLVTPSRSENGYRDYTDEEVRLFQKIIILRKLGIGVAEIRDLIEHKADLHEVLEHNVERLRIQQTEIASAIEMCEELDAEAAGTWSVRSAYSPEGSLNASGAVATSDGWAMSHTTSFNPGQLLKALLPMKVTVGEMVRSVRKTQPSKAAYPIAVTEVGMTVFRQPATSLPVPDSMMALHPPRES